MHDLNPAKLDTLSPGWHADGGGLFLVVTKAGSRSWVVKYSVKDAGGDRKTMGLGGLSWVSLKDARKKAETIRSNARDGVDPQAKRHSDARDDQVIPTFGAFADARLPTLTKGHKSQKTVVKWTVSLQTHATPIRDIRIDKVTSGDILKLLEPHFARAPSTGRDLRSHLAKVFSAAMALPSQENPYRSRALGNPAALKDNLEHLIPKQPSRGKQKGPQPSMPYKEVPGFIPVLRSSRGVVAKALHLVLLTALRSTEVRELDWNEIDLDGDKVIRLHARRMKNSLDAEVPLSPQAVALFRELKQNSISNLVFAGRKAGQPISLDSMLKFLQTGKGKRPDCTVHGFRTSFRSWGQDLANHSRETLEFCLHHIEGKEAERAYKGGAMLEKRRAALTDWANYIMPSKPNLALVA